VSIVLGHWLSLLSGENYDQYHQAECAKSDCPGGKTFARGMLPLSLWVPDHPGAPPDGQPTANVATRLMQPLPGERR
jgi:hypothetical protein